MTNISLSLATMSHAVRKTDVFLYDVVAKMCQFDDTSVCICNV